MPNLDMTLNDDAEVDSDISEMCRQYWETDGDGSFTRKVAEIAQDFGINAAELGRTVKQHAVALVLDLPCPQCGNPTVVATRTDLSNVIKFPPRACESCVQRRKIEEKVASEELKSVRTAAVGAQFALDNDTPEIEPAELSIRHAFALAGLLAEEEEDFCVRTQPLSERSVSMAPTEELERVLVAELYSADLIRIHPDTPIGAFSWTDGNVVAGYYHRGATFYLPGSGSTMERARRYLEKFENLVEMSNWPNHWETQLPAFWLDLTSSDCEAYFTWRLKSLKFDFSPGEKTREVIRRSLQNLTPGQVYRLIWSSTRSASIYHLEKQVPKKQAANSAVTSLEKYLDRALAEGQTVDSYKKSQAAPTVWLWQALMVRALKLPAPMSYSPFGRTSSPLKLDWSAVDPYSFEGLVFQLVNEADDYSEVQWLMHTNAPDHGRDVSAIRTTHDSLSGSRHQRTVIQCKNWLSKSVTDSDIAHEVSSIDHWQNSPFEILIIATSGRFTADAVTWVERHNAKGVRPHVEMWNDAHLEKLLADRQHLILSYGLR